MEARIKQLLHGLPLLGLVAVFLGSMLWPARSIEAAPPTFPVTIATDVLNIRARPTTAAPVVGTLQQGDAVDVVATVAGEEVFADNVSWFRLPSGGYIYSGYTTAGNGARMALSRAGRWIEIDRSAQIARAYENGRVVYTAPVVVGVPAFPTPVGEFRILRRVLNETMNSATIGIDPNGPGGYYLENVLYTQYITNDGVALHDNWWSPPGAFGNYPTSHGCIGLRRADALFFWNFASIGTPVVIHP